jgi:hypothetical protein
LPGPSFSLHPPKGTKDSPGVKSLLDNSRTNDVFELVDLSPEYIAEGVLIPPYVSQVSAFVSVCILHLCAYMDYEIDGNQIERTAAKHTWRDVG